MMSPMETEAITERQNCARRSLAPDGVATTEAMLLHAESLKPSEIAGLGFVAVCANGCPPFLVRDGSPIDPTRDCLPTALPAQRAQAV